MRVRPRSLPPGWYPATAHGVRDAVQAMLAKIEEYEKEL